MLVYIHIYIYIYVCNSGHVYVWNNGLYSHCPCLSTCRELQIQLCMYMYSTLTAVRYEFWNCHFMICLVAKIVGENQVCVCVSCLQQYAWTKFNAHHDTLLRFRYDSRYDSFCWSLIYMNHDTWSWFNTRFDQYITRVCQLY
jgi:hypothetical protein